LMAAFGIGDKGKGRELLKNSSKDLARIGSPWGGDSDRSKRHSVGKEKKPWRQFQGKRRNLLFMKNNRENPWVQHSKKEPGLPLKKATSRLLVISSESPTKEREFKKEGLWRGGVRGDVTKRKKKKRGRREEKRNIRGPPRQERACAVGGVKKGS